MALRRASLWIFALFISLAVGSLERSASAAPKIKTFLCPSQPIVIFSSAGDQVAAARFRMELRPDSFGSNHTGGANFLFGDGSVRFLRATSSDFTFDAQGNLIKIEAEMIEPNGDGHLFFHILPFIEQDNLYNVHVSGGKGDFFYKVRGRLVDGAPRLSPRR